MAKLTKSIHVLLIVLNIFLALSAFAGGVQLLEGTYAPPVEMLEGSIFPNWIIPGASLFLIVGGGALFAVILLFRKSKFALLFSTTAGVIIMFFEFIEMLAIGSPAGVARALQIFYFSLGTAIVVTSMGAWFMDLQANPA